ncbi:MAG: hypothetical protein ACLGHQ_02930 [Acidimicrobiia bacterium]
MFGLIGLVIAATLPFFAATQVRTKMSPRATPTTMRIHARFQVIPSLTDTTLPTLAWHIRIVTAAAVMFLLGGASIRFGGYPIFEQ